MTITFQVDDVKPATTPPPTLSLGEHLGDALAIGGDPELRVLKTPGVHPLLSAVHAAFAEHRPLVLSPDAIWLTIAQGFAQHVRLNAEALRSRLVRHQGRAQIQVALDGPLPETPAGWSQVIGAFRGQVAEHIGEGRARLLSCDFSTSTEIDRVAGEIILMDAYSPYFDYVLTCICGIPEITLMGTVDDWKAIRARVDVLAEFDLFVWAASLSTIIDQFIEAAEGRPDIDFFRHIYKPEEAYGADLVTGWIARLYPYVKSQGRFDAVNPLLDVPLEWKRKGLLKRLFKRKRYDGPGITSDSVPAQASSCLLDVKTLTDKRFDVVLEGGVMAVAVDAAGRLQPCSAYRVRKSEASIGAVIDELRRHPQAVVSEAAPKPNTGAPKRLWDLELPAELRAFYDVFEEAVLFGGWSMRPLREHQPIALAASEHGSVKRFLDLPDGTFIAYWAGRKTVFVHMRSDALAPYELAEGEVAMTNTPQMISSERPEEVPVVGESAAAILMQALRSEGDTQLATSSKLIDALPEWAR